jgi:hypothetical protein
MRPITFHYGGLKMVYSIEDIGEEIKIGEKDVVAGCAGCLACAACVACAACIACCACVLVGPASAVAISGLASQLVAAAAICSTNLAVAIAVNASKK